MRSLNWLARSARDLAARKRFFHPLRFELLESRLLLAADFGDAPDPTFPTLAASNGAQHVVVAGFHFGVAADMEANGQPNAAATGDNANGTNDDDGVTLLASLVASTAPTTSSALITASLNGAAGLLQGWIDFNGDGDWTDAGEQVATNIPLNEGGTVLVFTVPANATPGTTFARWRLSTTANLSPTGAAADGEVEDYQVTILAAGADTTVALPAGILAQLSVAGNDVVLQQGGATLFQAPAASLNSLTINGTDANSDLLSIDLTDATVLLPGGLVFHGGVGGADNDRLIVTGGTFASAAHTFTTTGPENSGTIIYNNGVDLPAIQYDGLEPVDMTGSTIDDLVFNLPGTADLPFLEDDGVLANGISQIRSGGGTFETTTFSNTVTSVTVNMGGDAGAMTVGALPDFTKALTINGQAGADTVVFQGTTTFTTLAVDVGGTITDAAGASITVTGDATLTATGPITLADNATDVWSVSGNASFAGSPITIDAAGTANFSTLTFNAAGAVTITEDSATVLTGTNTADSVTLKSNGSLTDAVATSLTVDGNATFSTLLGNPITLGDDAADSTNFGTLNFKSAGWVTITEDSSTALAATSQGDKATINSAGAITDFESDAAAEVGARFLILKAVGGVGELAEPIHIGALSLDVSNDVAGAIFLTSIDGFLTLLDEDSDGHSVFGIGGNGEIRSNGFLSIRSDAITAGGMTYTAADSAGASDFLEVDLGVTVQDTTSLLVLNAGDNFILHPTSTLNAATTVTINGDFGNADAGDGTFVHVLGVVIASNTITINTDDDDDTVNLSFAPGSSGTATVNTLTGADTINVRTLTEATPTTINAGDGADTVNVSSGAPGNIGNVNGIAAALTINGDVGADTLNVSDIGGAGDAAGMLSATTITGLGNAGTITYSTFETLNLDLNNFGAGTLTITGTHGGATNIDGNGGSDTINVQATAAGSTTTINGDAGHDTIALGSAANQLSALLGSLTVNGGANAPAPMMTESVTAKGQVISQTLAVGDTLTINDQGYASAAQYNLSATTFNRDSTSAITTFATIETINLNTGSAANDINITSTPASGKTTVTSQDAADDIDITTTGANSILLVNAAGGADAVDIATTGAASVTIINGGAGGDTLTQVTSGAASGVALNGQGAADTITILNSGADSSTLATGSTDNDVIEIVTAGANSRVQVDGDAGADDIAQRALPVTAQAQLNGGDDNDTITLGSTTNVLSGILGSVMIDGGVHDAAPTMTETVKTVTQTLAVGDTLNLNDQGYGAAAQYNLSDTTFNRDGTVAVTMYAAIETINLNAGSAADDINITDTPDGSKTTVTTQDAADDIDVTVTGNSSILLVNSAGSGDAIDVLNTGVDSVTRLTSAAGADTINIAASGAGSGIESIAGAANDVINLGDGGNILTNILGLLNLLGGDHDAMPTTTESVTCAPTTVTQTLAVGDTLNINDQGYAAAAQYNLSDMTFDRDGTIAVTMYVEMETINLNAGAAANDINVTDTPDAGRTTVTSQSVADDIDIATTGDGSIFIVNAGDGADAIDIATTGAGSVSLFNGDTGGDTLTLVTTGGVSSVALRGLENNDTLNVRTTATGSAVVADGGSNNDTINVSSDAPVNAGTLDGIDGRLCIVGGAHDAAPTQPVRESVPLNPQMPYSGPPMSNMTLAEAPATDRPVGDTLNVSDAASGTAIDFLLNATTMARSNGPTLAYMTLETINIVTGSGDNDLQVDLPLQPPFVVTFDGNVGADHLVVNGTAGDDVFKVSDTTDAAGDQGLFRVADTECLHLLGDVGNDTIINDTNVCSQIEGQDGDDVLVGGSNLDVIVGGDGVDALFGRGGDDWLFPDLDINNNSFPLGGELIDGGAENTAIPGDTAAQLGNDLIKNIESLGDGGGTKDVLTWLRARLVNVVLQQGLDAALAAGCDLTPPVIVVLAVAPLQNPRNHRDVNDDGRVTPVDGLIVINHLNAFGSGSLAGEDTPQYFIDTSGDGYVSPLDALIVINTILGRDEALRGSIGAEGEGSPSQGNDATHTALVIVAPVRSHKQSSTDRDRMPVRGIIATPSNSRHGQRSPTSRSPARLEHSADDEKSLTLDEDLLNVLANALRP